MVEDCELRTNVADAAQRAQHHLTAHIRLSGSFFLYIGLICPFPIIYMPQKFSGTLNTKSRNLSKYDARWTFYVHDAKVRSTLTLDATAPKKKC